MTQEPARRRSAVVLPRINERDSRPLAYRRCPPDCNDELVRIDRDPAGPEFVLLTQYPDYQRERMLSKTNGLTREQLARKHPPSELTLGGLLYHLSLVEEDWMEVRFAGLPEREPWAKHRLGRRPGLGGPHCGDWKR